MPGPIFLNGDSIELRTITEEDLDFVYKAVNDKEIWGSLRRIDPATKAEVKNAYINSSNTTRFLICDENERVGCIWLRQKHVMKTWGVARLGYWVIRSEWGNNYATQAVNLIKSYCYDHRRIRKLGAYVLESNDRSKTVLQNNGFQKEAVHKNEAFVDGEYIDRLYLTSFKENR